MELFMATFMASFMGPFAHRYEFSRPWESKAMMQMQVGLTRLAAFKTRNSGKPGFTRVPLVVCNQGVAQGDWRGELREHRFSSRFVDAASRRAGKLLQERR